MRILFFGTPTFAAHVLEYLVQKGEDIVAVVTQPDRPKGRSQQRVPPPVKVTTQRVCPSVPIYQPEKASAPAFVETLATLEADIFVVVAYGEILRQHVLDMPRLGCINLHASLLPKYRGAAPIQRAIINGERETGVTIMHMVRKMDAGDWIAQRSVPIPAESTYGETEEALCQAGSSLLYNVIQNFSQGIIKRIPQDESKVTFSPKITVEDCCIHWGETTQNIHNLIRGVNPHPGAWCWLEMGGKKKRCKIWKAQPLLREAHEEPGTPVFLEEGEWGICCKDHVLQILALQLEGKNKVDAKDFQKGIPLHECLFVEESHPS